MTVKGALSVETDRSSMDKEPHIGTIPCLASSELFKPSEPVRPIETKNMRAQSEDTVPEKAASRPTAVGTHRFTLLRKDLALMNGKKVSSRRLSSLLSGLS